MSNSMANIGMVANGAGLGLATLDMVVAAKGRPANFMDIRTTAKSLDIAQGFRLLLDNPATKAILINVHGGGMQPCDTIAEGLGIAMRRTGRSLPLVVRLAGNNADFARSRFKNFGCAVDRLPRHVDRCREGRVPRRRREPEPWPSFSIATPASSARA